MLTIRTCPLKWRVMWSYVALYAGDKPKREAECLNCSEQSLSIQSIFFHIFCRHAGWRVVGHLLWPKSGQHWRASCSTVGRPSRRNSGLPSSPGRSARHDKRSLVMKQESFGSIVTATDVCCQPCSLLRGLWHTAYHITSNT